MEWKEGRLIYIKKIKVKDRKRFRKYNLDRSFGLDCNVQNN